MPTVPLYTRSSKDEAPRTDTPPNPLPQLLQTPSGLAILELQGTINLPARPASEGNAEIDTEAGENNAGAEGREYQTPIGRLVFPDYDSSNPDANQSNNWQKRVHLYVGLHQRMTGEVKKLPKPLAIIRRRHGADAEGSSQGVIEADDRREEEVDELEIVEIIRHKIIFSSRPEPFTDVLM
jgi:chromosome transmission fidelity protein 8